MTLPEGEWNVRFNRLYIAWLILGLGLLGAYFGVGAQSPGPDRPVFQPPPPIVPPESNSPSSVEFPAPQAVGVNPQELTAPAKKPERTVHIIREKKPEAPPGEKKIVISVPPGPRDPNLFKQVSAQEPALPPKLPVAPSLAKEPPAGFPPVSAAPMTPMPPVVPSQGPREKIVVVVPSDEPSSKEEPRLPVVPPAAPAAAGPVEPKFPVPGNLPIEVKPEPAPPKKIDMPVTPPPSQIVEPALPLPLTPTPPSNPLPSIPETSLKVSPTPTNKPRAIMPIPETPIRETPVQKIPVPETPTLVRESPPTQPVERTIPPTIAQPQPLGIPGGETRTMPNTGIARPEPIQSPGSGSGAKPVPIHTSSVPQVRKPPALKLFPGNEPEPGIHNVIAKPEAGVSRQEKPLLMPSGIQGEMPPRTVASTPSAAPVPVEALKPATAFSEKLPIPSKGPEPVMPLVVDTVGEGPVLPKVPPIEPAPREEESYPQLAVEKQGPMQGSGPNRTIYVLVLRNTGKVPAHQVRVEDELPPKTQVVASNPKPTIQGMKAVWNVGTLGAGEERRLALEILGAIREDFLGKTYLHMAPVQAPSTARPDSFQPRPEAASGLKVEVLGPAQGLPGQNMNYEIRIQNTGNQPAADVALNVHLSGGLVHARGHDLGAMIGTLPPGAVRTMKLPLKAIGKGPQIIDVQVLPKGGQKTMARYGVALQASANQNIPEPQRVDQVQGFPDLAIRIEPRTTTPEVGKETLYQVYMNNRGNMPATNVRVVVQLAEGLALGKAADGPVAFKAQGRQVVFEPISRLDPKGQAVYTLGVVPETPGDRAFRVQVMSDQYVLPLTRELRQQVLPN